MKKSLQRGIGLNLLLLILIPVFAFSLISLAALNSIVSGQLERHQQSIFHLIENSIRETINSPIYELEEIMSIYDQGMLEPQNIDDYLQFKVDNHELLLSLYVLDIEGQVIYAPSNQPQEVGNDYSQFPFFTQVKESRDFYWTSTFMSTVFSEITFAFSLRHEDGLVFVGFYSLNSLQEMLDKLNIDKNEKISIFNDSRFYLAHSNADLVAQRAQELFLDLNKDTQVIKIQGKKQIVHIVFLEDLNLYVARYSDYFQYFLPLISVVIANLSMLLFIFILIFAYTRTQSLRITGQIQSLVDGSSQIAQGNYQVEILQSHYLELNILAENFNRMALKIRRAMEEQKSLNDSLKDQIQLVKENESQLQLLMDFSYDGIVFLNAEKEILRVSRSAKSFFQLENPLEFVGEKCYHALLGVQNECESCLIEKTLQSRKTEMKTVELKGRLVEETSIPVLTETGNITGIIITYRDVTEKNDLERKLNRAIKLEAVGRFAGGIAHDFNNILQIIFGYTELLAPPVSESEKQEYLKNIHSTAEKAESLVKQLMAFCRLEDKAREPHGLDDILDDSIVMLDRLINDNYSIVEDLNSSRGKILAERNQIEQILMNLVVNARDAMPGKGNIFLRTGKTTRKDRDYLYFEVEDQGMGVPKKIQEKIFDPFFTTKDVGEGTGLGLATVFGIVEGHDGLLELESEEGKGSLFRILIPEYKDA